MLLKLFFAVVLNRQFGDTDQKNTWFNKENMTCNQIAKLPNCRHTFYVGLLGFEPCITWLDGQKTRPGCQFYAQGIGPDSIKTFSVKFTQSWNLSFLIDLLKVVTWFEAATKNS